MGFGAKTTTPGSFPGSWDPRILGFRAFMLCWVRSEDPDKGARVQGLRFRGRSCGLGLVLQMMLMIHVAQSMHGLNKKDPS